ncbi:MAG: hypothetical protein CM15mP102_05350 [Flavobacteriales bacterium]|nr:MAG: hypothetical protein CM15mP102_05350 [Flavobacteriales bacterium]
MIIQGIWCKKLEKQIAKLIRNRAKNIVSNSKLNNSKDQNFLKMSRSKKFFRDKYGVIM